ncbi:hypothetical protein BBBOND_0209670 [Babesia bigemina]|uniref:Uncharacterized protein n=1 Tax=Babesia bigemina TaxID=5866 RepID=A0A061DAB4_BABBI|nr:hypothetical protein BBBOND_0209670 [Babesia bigemina]CDR95814.1 hypothetical protein BBBOND_0209670 [Babesia bigemina]|eukprot:XP_012768000.1 hypothetical protein BBBOND_0209670 [Babesia bigemina]
MQQSVGATLNLSERRQQATRNMTDAIQTVEVNSSSPSAASKENLISGILLALVAFWFQLKKGWDEVWKVLSLEHCPLCVKPHCGKYCVYVISICLILFIGLLYYVLCNPLRFFKGIFCCFF